MSLRQKKYTVFAVMLGIPVLLILIEAGLERIGLDTYETFVASFFLVEITGYCLYLCWMRCPHCGEHLNRNFGQYCQHCGKEIGWDDKASRKGD